MTDTTTVSDDTVETVDFPIDTAPEPIDVPVELDRSELRFFTWDNTNGSLWPAKRMDLRSATTRQMDPRVVWSIAIPPEQREMSLDELAALYPAPRVDA